MDGPHQALLLALAFFLVLLNGFFVAAEFAIVKLRGTRAEAMARHYRLPGRVLRHVRTHLDAYLSACQLGITLASLGLGWIGEPAVARLIEPLVAPLGLGPGAVSGISFTVAFLVISYLHIVLGELAPKSIAIRRPEITGLWTAMPLWLFHFVMYPFIWFLNGSALFMLRFMGFDLGRGGDEAHSPEELKQILAASHLHGDLSREQWDILRRTLEFADLKVADVMQPASDMVALDLRKNAEENLALIDRFRFSRYPVCDGGIDRIVGLAHIKDLYGRWQPADGMEKLRPLLRHPLIVREDTPAFRLYRLFRKGYPHLAVVDDAVGNVVGFVTLEDLQEAMAGHIEDEFRRTREDWVRLSDGSLVGTGTLPLHGLERLLNRRIGTDQHTIGGLVLSRLDRVPRAGERVRLDGFEVEVTRMRGPIIAEVRVFPDPPEPATSPSGP
jgi:CBS domain containing-hemolysin-like protein